MAFDRERHHRQSIRLDGYDYSLSGANYITVCTYQRECLFGRIVDDQVSRNALGAIVQEEWLQTATVRSDVWVDAFIVMPNHVHGILILSGGEGRVPEPQPRLGEYTHPQRPAPSSICAIVGQFKAAATRRINSIRGTPGAPV